MMINKLSRYLVNIGKLYRGKLWQQENLANLVNDHVFSYFYHPKHKTEQFNNFPTHRLHIHVPGIAY